MRMKTWLNNLKLQKKLMLIYVIFMFLPIIAVTIYFSIRMNSILVEKSYDNMRKDAEQVGRGVEATFSAYATILDLLYLDEKLNSYMVMDYSNESYWDMFSYIDSRMMNVMALIPSIEQISIYSTNKTIPHDNYYFYDMSELNEKWYDKGITSSGSITLAGLSKGNQGIALERRLNYYITGNIENIILLSVRADVISNQLVISKDKNMLRILVDQEGTIIASGEPTYVGRSIESLSSNWENVKEEQETELDFMNNQKYCIVKNSACNTKLVILTNKDNLTEEAVTVTRKIFYSITILSVLIFFAIWLYSKWFTRKVDKVVYAAKSLGEGHFDYILKDMGTDEIGMIADAFNLLNERIQVLIQENYEKKLRIKSSEINLLQEQINPHFLYNALAVISSLSMRERNEKTTQSIRYLSDFYRISLNKGKQILSIQEELQLLKEYMKIQELRFEESIHITYEVKRELLPYRTIKLILQPLVENAIQHGRRSEEEVLHIQITIEEERDKVIFLVEDDGIGIEAERLHELQEKLRHSEEGYGLKNVDIRVKLNYGEEYGVKIASQLGKGTKVRVDIPKIE
jgi:two-component system sensor histidine kinase YesM